MTRKYRTRVNKEPKGEVIDLTDIGNHNTMPVVRELETNPVTGSVAIRAVTDPPTVRNDAFKDSPVQFIEEDKGQGYQQPVIPPDPDGDFDEILEKEGAFIIDSTTLYTASKQRVTRKSLTPAEIAEQRMWQAMQQQS